MNVDSLSDTTYRQQAKEQLDKLLDNVNHLLDNGKFPVKRTQIYGLREIARQQPREVKKFANHQRERTRRKKENRPYQAEIEFWTLVANLCSNSTSDWSVNKEGRSHLPEELRDKNIPKHRPGMTHEEQRDRNERMEQQRERLAHWENEHIPAFFERFCTHALYRLGLAENS